MKAGAVAGIFIAAIVALIAYSTFRGSNYRAEVCMDFDGRHACKKVKAKSEDGAVRAGTEGSCADIASGVTETMKCMATPPASVKWLERPH